MSGDPMTMAIIANTAFTVAGTYSEIQDAKYKINAIEEHNMVIPEHTDITGEVDKLLCKISSAEDKLAVIRRHYGENKAEKTLL